MCEKNGEFVAPLFDIEDYDETNNWTEEWKNMPEYDNSEEEAPRLIAVIKFRNREDFEDFNSIIEKHLFDGERPFDGMQRENRKTTWYPHKEKASNYRYIDESEI